MKIPKPHFLLGVVTMTMLMASEVSAKLQLQALIGDHMVVQQGQPVVVWGWDQPGHQIRVEMAGRTASTKADAQGHWKVSLHPLEAGGPYEMAITGSGSVTVRDILVGEVWLASGQSNMEFVLRSASGGKEEADRARYPQMRFFTVERNHSFVPLKDVKGSWKVCNPETAAEFSAVAYSFGKELQKSLQVPVGLIASDWGGTPAEAWTPRRALLKNRDFAPLVKQWEGDKAQMKAWKRGVDFELWLKDPCLIPKDARRKPVTLALDESEAGKAEGMGEGWVHAEQPGAAVIFKTWRGFRGDPTPLVRFEGHVAGGGYASISNPLAPDGRTADLSSFEALQLQVRGKGRFFLTLPQPSITDWDSYATDSFELSSEWQSMTVPLASLHQGGWGIHKPFTPYEIQSVVLAALIPYWPKLPSIVYNAMIAPLTPYRIQGVIWYQGESNVERAPQYHELLSTMIGSWRKAWGAGDFPFLVVQLPNYQPLASDPTAGHWAELREAQLQALDVPNTGVVTTIDLGEAENLHPRDKKDVGQRLALQALVMAYHKPVVCSGPLLDDLVKRGSKLILRFKRIGLGLVANGGEPWGFEVAGYDHRFYPAHARILGDRVEVSSPSVQDPLEVRYGWADNPACNLYNEEGLPASPFRAQVGK